MAKLNDLIVTIGAQTRQFDKALGQSMRKMQNFGKSTKQLGQSMTRSLTMPIAALGAAAIKSAADLETMETSFISLTGGAKQAADMMRNLNDFTAKTPFQIEAVAKSARQLIASGSGIDEVNTQLQFLGDIAATSGQPIDEIAAIFAKVNAKGKVELENLNQLAERGIPIFTALSEATGLPADKLGAGRVSVEQFNDTLKSFATEGGFAAGAMERLSQTAAGKFSTALDNLKLAGASLAESLMPVLKDMLDKFTGLMQTITQLSPETKKYVLIAAGIGAALGPLLMILPSIIQGFMMLMSPIGLTIAAIVGLGIAIVTFADEIAPYITGVINYFITLYNESSLLRGIIGGIKGTVQVVFDFFLFAVDSVIEGFKDLGAVIGAVMRGDFSAIPELIGQAFTNAGERMADFGKKAAEDFMTAVEDQVNREPISLVSEDTVAETLRTLGGLTTMMDNLFAGAGGGAVEGPSVTPPVIDTTLNIVDIDMPEDVVEEEDINQVIAAADLVKRQTQAMAQSVAGFVEHTFNQVMSGTQTFSEVMRDMLKNLVKQIAVMIAQFVILNTIFGSMGVGGLSLGKFIGQGLGIPQFAGGGIVSGPVIAQVGEYAGASHNPEVIAPLDKLQSMMGGQSVQVTGKISGRDILLTSERNSIDRNRVRGF
jgi:tape measure domain-containing protein